MKVFFKIIILSVIIMLSACSKKQVVLNEADITNDIFYYKNTVKPFSGTCLLLFNDSEQVKMKIQFREGKMHGLTQQFFINGNLRMHGNYKNGLLSGKWEAWYQNGKLAYSVNYCNDSLNGKYTEYYENGNLKESGEYSMNRKSGNWQYYHTDGSSINKQMAMLQ